MNENMNITKYCTFYRKSDESYPNQVVHASYDEFRKYILKCYYDDEPEIHKYLTLCYGNDTKQKIFETLDSEEIFQEARKVTNLIIGVIVNLYVYVAKDPKKSHFPAVPVANKYISFNTIRGLDDEFDLLLEELKITLEGIPLLFSISKMELNTLELNTVSEKNIIKKGFHNISISKPRGYSSLKLSDVNNNFLWATWEDLKVEEILENISNNTVTSNHLQIRVTDSSNDAKFEERVDLTIKYLNLLNELMKPPGCYFEANRRLIINIFLIAALSPYDDEIPNVYLNAEHNLQSDVNRIGSGALDYYINYDEEKNAIISTVPKFDNDDNDDNDVNDVGVLDLGISVNSDNERAISNSTVLEAKVNIDLAKENLLKATGQLTSQMIDSQNSTSRKRKSISNSIELSDNFTKDKKAVTGILSTGHHNMIFSLSPSENGGKPVMNFHGDFRVDILLKTSNSGVNRESGSNNKNQEISRDQVRNVIKAIYYSKKL